MTRRIKQSRHSGDTFWTNLIYHNQESVPVVTTDDLTMGFATNATAEGTVVSGSGITSYGFVWALHDSPTIADEIAEDGTSDFSGAFSKEIFGLPYGEGLVYFAAYATNSVGTGYGSVLSGDVEICLAAGTKIHTLFGKKNIEDISYSDELFVWNFDDGTLDISQPVWMVRPFTSRSCATVKFSDGLELTTVNDGLGHRIFNMEQGRFTHMMSDDTPIGTTTFTEYGLAKVISKHIEKKKTTFYNVITNHHMNVFANTILTSTGLNNIYPITDMKFVKDDRALRTEIICSEDLFNGFRLAEQPLAYPDLQAKISRLSQRRWEPNEALV